MRFKSDSQRRAVFSNLFSKKNVVWLVFGDSIVMGYNDHKGGWVERFKEMVYPNPVYNLGVDGDCAKDVARRIVDESHRRLKSGDSANIILAVGLNDSKEKLSEGSDKFDELLDLAESIIDKKNITVVGLTPVDDNKTNPVVWDRNINYYDKRVVRLDDDIKKICDDRDVAYIGIHDRLTVADLDDGLHPNASGHNKIFDAISEAEDL
jgi:lysophospholipase L1-like esterase